MPRMDIDELPDEPLSPEQFAAEIENTLTEEEEADDLTLEMEEVENAILGYCFNTYSDSRASVEARHRQWRSYWRRYRGKHVEHNDDSPMAGLNPAKLARIVDAARARIYQLCLPDPDRCDIFELIPRPANADELPAPEMRRYAGFAQCAVSTDLVEGEFPREFRRMLLDLFVTGNMVAKVCWTMKRGWKVVREENPEYDPQLPPEANVRVDESGNVRPVSPFKVRTEPYFEYDAPRVEHIYSGNIYPAELDRDSLDECSAVCVYDTVRRDELMDEDIAGGGYLYANLDKLDTEFDDPNASETDWREESHIEDGESVSNFAPPSARLRRITYMGRLVLSEIMSKEVRPEVIQALQEKWGIDPDKGFLSGWKNWVVEIINDGVMVRCQPVPYLNDEIPLIHFGLYPKPKVTLAEGFYDRGVAEEIIYNAMQRFRLEMTMKIVRPLWGVTREFLAQDQQQVQEGRIVYRPNGIVYLTAGKSINEAIQPLRVDPQALTASDSMMERQDKTMAELTHSPNIRSGSSSTAPTATQDVLAGQSADAIAECQASYIESEFLRKIVGSVLKLHHQYSMENKLACTVDPEGQEVFLSVPPEVWANGYYVRMVAYRRVGNAAARLLAMKEFASLAFEQGWGNPPEILGEMARLQNFRQWEKMLKPPEPPAFPMDFKGSSSYIPKADLLPPSLNAKIVAKMFGVDVTPEEVMEMIAIKQAEDFQEVGIPQTAPMDDNGTLQPEQSPAGPPPEGAMAPPAGGQPGQMPQMPMGMPPQMPMGAPSPQGGAAPEWDPGYRGLMDSEGVSRSLGQKLKGTGISNQTFASRLAGA